MSTRNGVVDDPTRRTVCVQNGNPRLLTRRYRGLRTDHLGRQLRELIHKAAQLGRKCTVVKTADQANRGGKFIKDGQQLLAQLLGDETFLLITDSRLLLDGGLALLKTLRIHTGARKRGQLQAVVNRCRMSFRRDGTDGTVGDCRHHLTQGLDADIAGSKDSLDIRLLVLIRDDVVLLIEIDQPTKQLRIRYISGKDKDAKGLALFRHVMFDLPRRVVAKVCIGDHCIAADTLHHSIEADTDVFVIRERIHHRLRCTEFVPAHNYRNRTPIAGKKDALLNGRKSAADDEDIHPREELCVASRTVGDAAPTELLLTGKADPTRIRSRRENHAQCLNRTCCCLYFLDVLIQLQSRDLGADEFRPEATRLMFHLRCELGAAHASCPGIVDHIGSDGDLPTDLLLFDDKHLALRARQIDRGRQSCGTAADNHGIIHIFHKTASFPPHRKKHLTSALAKCPTPYA